MTLFDTAQQHGLGLHPGPLNWCRMMLRPYEAPGIDNNESWTPFYGPIYKGQCVAMDTAAEQPPTKFSLSIGKVTDPMSTVRPIRAVGDDHDNFSSAAPVTRLVLVAMEDCEVNRIGRFALRGEVDMLLHPGSDPILAGAPLQLYRDVANPENEDGSVGLASNFSHRYVGISREAANPGELFRAYFEGISIR